MNPSSSTPRLLALCATCMAVAGVAALISRQQKAREKEAGSDGNERTHSAKGEKRKRYFLKAERVIEVSDDESNSDDDQGRKPTIAERAAAISQMATHSNDSTGDFWICDSCEGLISARLDKKKRRNNSQKATVEKKSISGRTRSASLSPQGRSAESSPSLFQDDEIGARHGDESAERIVSELDSAFPETAEDPDGVYRFTCVQCKEFDLCRNCIVLWLRARREASAQGGATAALKTSPSVVTTESQWPPEKAHRSIARHTFDHAMQAEQVFAGVPRMHVLAQPTMRHVLERMFELYADRWAMGVRTLISEDPVQLGRYRWMTYREMGQHVRNFGAGLVELGIPEASRVAICGENCAEWFISEYACAEGNLVSVPVHTTVSDDDLEYILCDASVSVCIIQRKFLPTFLRVCVRSSRRQANVNSASNSCEAMPRPLAVNVIVVMSDWALRAARPTAEPSVLSTSGQTLTASSTSAHAASIEIFTMQEVENIGSVVLHPSTDTGAGRGRAMVQAAQDTEKLLYSIVYTSGSTGKPKGVMLSEGVYRRDVTKPFRAGNPFCILSYRPLAHMTDRKLGAIIFANGGRIGFVHDNDIGNLFDDAKEFRPVSFAAAPRVWHMLYTDFCARVTALCASRAEDEARQIALREFSLFFGNRCRSVSTGGAATAPKVLEWMRDCFEKTGGIVVSEGFGTTECSSIARTGVMNMENEWKLLDVPEMGYFSTDIPPKGELLVRTPYMSDGYLNRDEETRDSFDADGFFHTGDIVELNGAAQRQFGDANVPVTFIRLLDRRKNFFKMAQGVFVAPDQLENIFLESASIQSIFIHGEITYSVLVCVVVPKTDSAHVLETSADVLAELGRIGRARGLRAFEIPKAVYIERERAFTPENGLMTPSWKSCRPALRSHYAVILEQMLIAADDEASAHHLESTLLEKDDGIARVVLRQLAQASGRTETTMVALDRSKIFLRDICVDSLSAVRLTRGIDAFYMKTQHVRINVPIAMIFDVSSTLQSLVEFVESRLTKTEPLTLGISAVRNGFDLGVDPTDLQAEIDLSLIQLDKLLQSLLPEVAACFDCEPSFPKRFPVNSAFVTGATGFVGMFVLDDLMQRTGRRAICLVRGADSRRARARLLRAATDLGAEHVKQALASGRITVLNGDLELDLFGLERGEFFELVAACRFGDIFHCGAWVNTVLPHSELRRANVYGTSTSLLLACLAHAAAKIGPPPDTYGGFVAFHHISTLSVTRSKNPVETADLNPAVSGRGGYGSTKFVADQLVVRAARRYRYFRTNIFRLGSVSAHSRSGASNVVDFQTRFLCGMIQLGAYPVAPTSMMQFAPVDFVARAIVALSMRADSSVGTGPGGGQELQEPGIYHLVNPQQSPSVLQVGKWLHEIVLHRHQLSISAAEAPLRTMAPLSTRQWIAALHEAVSATIAPFEPSSSGDVQDSSNAPPDAAIESSRIVSGREALGERNALEPLLGYFDAGSIPTEKSVSVIRASAALEALGDEEFNWWTPVDAGYFGRIVSWLLDRQVLV